MFKKNDVVVNSLLLVGGRGGGGGGCQQGEGIIIPLEGKGKLFDCKGLHVHPSICTYVQCIFNISILY